MKLLRYLYQVLLLAHPAGFRQRFRGEMLDIFDSSANKGNTAYLLCDAMRSVLIQHARPALHTEKAATFCLEVQTSSLTFARVSQATVLGASLLLVLASLLVREMPPISDFDDQPACHELGGPKTVGKLVIKR